MKPMGLGPPFGVVATAAFDPRQSFAREVGRTAMDTKRRHTRFCNNTTVSRDFLSQVIR